jgi:hypothetical protein
VVVVVVGERDMGLKRVVVWMRRIEELFWN